MNKSLSTTELSPEDLQKFHCMDYLIVSLPRARSAWLSTLLNLTPEVHCMHEPILSGKMQGAYMPDKPSATVLGATISGSISMFPINFWETYQGKVLMIVRPISGSIKSVHTMFPKADLALLEESIDIQHDILRQVVLPSLPHASNIMFVLAAALDEKAPEVVKFLTGKECDEHVLEVLKYCSISAAWYQELSRGEQSHG